MMQWGRDQTEWLHASKASNISCGKQQAQAASALLAAIADLMPVGSTSEGTEERGLHNKQHCCPRGVETGFALCCCISLTFAGV